MERKSENIGKGLKYKNVVKIKKQIYVGQTKGKDGERERDELLKRQMDAS